VFNQSKTQKSESIIKRHINVNQLLNNQRLNMNLHCSSCEDISKLTEASSRISEELIEVSNKLQCLQKEHKALQARLKEIKPCHVTHDSDPGDVNLIDRNKNSDVNLIDRNKNSDVDGSKTVKSEVVFKSSDIRQKMSEVTYGNSGEPGYSDFWETAIDEELDAYVAELKGKAVKNILVSKNLKLSIT
jgi:hypothetical protein